jgi:GcrA cell cycle regulator
MTYPPRDPWTIVEDEILRYWWRRGLASQRIVNHLQGRTRSAILGRAHRLGLPAREPCVVRHSVRRAAERKHAVEQGYATAIGRAADELP